MIIAKEVEANHLRRFTSSDQINLSTANTPFIGRVEETEAIKQFHAVAFDEDSTSALWIWGETGIGKSYLMRYVSNQFESSGDIVFHIQFYPHGSLSIIGLLWNQLTGRQSLHPFLSETVHRTASSVIASLRRLTRLRPTTILLEDVHLLDETSSSELSMLISGISQEPVCLICTARPKECPGYTTVLPWTASSITLQPFSRDEVKQLFAECGVPQSDNIVELAHQSTHGIPLILRSVVLELRRMGSKKTVNTDTPVMLGSRIRERTNAIAESLTKSIEQEITIEERTLLQHLAPLGEVFSEEAAKALVNNAHEIIERGISAGILVYARNTPRPLWGTHSSSYPIAFAHSLLHEKFLQSGAMLSAQDCLTLLKSDAAIYSTLPVQCLTLQTSNSDDVACLPGLVFALSEHSRKLLHTLDWRLSSPMLATLLQFYQQFEHTVPAEQKLILKLEIIEGQMFALRMKLHSEELREILEHYSKLTEEPSSMEVALYRCSALSWTARVKYNAPLNGNYHFPESIFDEAFDMVKRFPELTGHNAFISLLASLASHPKKSNAQREKLRQFIYTVMDAVSESDAAMMLYYRLVPNLFLDLASSEHAEEGLSLIRKGMEEQVGHDPLGLRFVVVLPFLIAVGEWQEAEHLIKRYITKPISGRSLEAELRYRAMEIMLAACIGLPIEETEYLLRTLTEELTDHLHGIAHETTYLFANISVWIAMIGNLRADPDWATLLIEEICMSPYPEHQALESAILSGDRDGIQKALNIQRSDSIAAIARFYVGGSSEWNQETAQTVLEVLQENVFSLKGILHLNVMMVLLERMPASDIPKEVSAALPHALKKGLDWCIDKQYAGAAAALLMRGHALWKATEIRKWKNRISRCRTSALKTRSFGLGPSPTNIPRITMMGEIAVQLNGSPPVAIHGLRARHTLGLMVANPQMRQPVSLEAFRRLATGMETDPAGAANYLRIIVSRLRNILGKQSIISNGEQAPYLNREVVHVDILEAASRLDNCYDAIRTMRPRRAVKNLLAVLESMKNQTLYPGLEGDFFEAARRDFEIRIREAVLSTTYLLCRENDYAEATKLLHTVTTHMPDDEEITEEFVKILSLSKRTAEALSVERKWV